MSDDAPAGVPEWIVTYGDMMSLLLTFFIMLVSLSEVKGDHKYQAMVEAIMRRMGYLTTTAAPAGGSFPLGGLIHRLQTLGGHSNEQLGRHGVKRPGPEGEDLHVYRNREGTSIHIGDPVSFAPGSAELSPDIRQVLGRIAEKLAGKPNKIDVRGHTSSAPLPAGSPYADKIRLSYERGRGVLELLQNLGIERERMRVSAVADLEPLPPNPDRQSLQSDRVEILVLDAYARDFVGARDVRD